jgi:hypothetical protein
VLLPAWLAVIEQMPAATTVTVLPDTEQIPAVVLAKLTGKPDVAAELNAALAPTVIAAGCAKLIVCALIVVMQSIKISVITVPAPPVPETPDGLVTWQAWPLGWAPIVML